MSDSSRLKARDRIGQLVDEGSFVELDKYLERSNAVLGYKDVSVQGEGVVSVSYTHLHRSFGNAYRKTVAMSQLRHEAGGDRAEFVLPQLSFVQAADCRPYGALCVPGRHEHGDNF